jgi:hypothetical protein
MASEVVNADSSVPLWYRGAFLLLCLTLHQRMTIIIIIIVNILDCRLVTITESLQSTELSNQNRIKLGKYCLLCMRYD